MNILLVDKEAESLKILQYTLSYFENVQIEQAVDCASAMDLYNAKDYELVMVDSEIDCCLASDFISNIKSSGKNSFIVCTSRFRASAKINKMLRAGASDFINKPYIPHLLRNRLNNYIKIIESRKYSVVYKKSLNIFNEPCFPFFSTFKISHEDDLVCFWDFMSDLHTNNCQHGKECRVDIALKAVYSVAMALLRLSCKTMIFVEQNDYCYYFTFNDIRGLNEKIISELIEKEIEQHKDIRYLIDGSKLSIEAYNLEKLPACSLEQKKDFISNAANVVVETAAAKPDVIATNRNTEFRVFDFIDAEDLIELRDYLNDLDSSLVPLQYSSLSSNEVIYLADTISKIAIILGGYNETFNISVALRSLSLDIQDNIDTFIQKSQSLASLLIYFDSDLKSWQNSIFEVGAPSINYMDDSIIANAVSISNLLKPAIATQDDDLDDIFSF